MTDILQVTGLTRAYGAVRVASDVHFNVTEGEILGIIGPNGAGKTTLFGMLSGHVQPSAGKVVFRGEDMPTQAPKGKGPAVVLRLIGALPGASAWWITAAALLWFGLLTAWSWRYARWYGKPRADGKEG